MFVVCVVAFLIVAVGIGAIIFFSIVANGYEKLIEQDVEITISLHQVQSDLEKSALNVSTYLVTHEEQYAQEYEKAYQALQDRLTHLQSVTEGEELKRVKDISFEVQAYNSHLASLIGFVRQGQYGLMTMLLNQGLDQMNSTLDLTNDLIAEQRNELQAEIAATSKLISITQTRILVISIITAFIALAGGLYFSRTISKPLQRLEYAVAKIARGDLSYLKVDDIRSNDEIGRLVKSFVIMLENLRQLVREMQDKSKRVASASSQLSQGAEDINNSIQEATMTTNMLAVNSDVQEHEAEGVSHVTFELIENIHSATENAKNSNEGAYSTRKLAEGGRQALAKVDNKIMDIHNSIQAVSNAMIELVGSSRRIGEIINLISTIAEQTNLLALNAAIEAARAGDQGKGFAVVAEEVRKLAEESSKATGNIRGIIGDVQRVVVIAQEELEKSKQVTDDGVQAVKDANQTFFAIEAAIEEVAQGIEQVAIRLSNILASTDQVTSSVESILSAAKTVAEGAQNVAAVSEEQSASMEEVTSAALSLNEIAQDMEQATKKFILANNDR